MCTNYTTTFNTVVLIVVNPGHFFSAVLAATYYLTRQADTACLRATCISTVRGVDVLRVPLQRQRRRVTARRGVPALLS